MEFERRRGGFRSDAAVPSGLPLMNTGTPSSEAAYQVSLGPGIKSSVCVYVQLLSITISICHIIQLQGAVALHFAPGDIYIMFYCIAFVAWITLFEDEFAF